MGLVAYVTAGSPVAENFAWPAGASASPKVTSGTVGSLSHTLVACAMVAGMTLGAVVPSAQATLSVLSSVAVTR